MLQFEEWYRDIKLLFDYHMDNQINILIIPTDESIELLADPFDHLIVLPEKELPLGLKWKIWHLKYNEFFKLNDNQLNHWYALYLEHMKL